MSQRAIIKSMSTRQIKREIRLVKKRLKLINMQLFRTHQAALDAPPLRLYSLNSRHDDVQSRYETLRSRLEMLEDEKKLR